MKNLSAQKEDFLKDINLNSKCPPLE